MKPLKLSAILAMTTIALSLSACTASDEKAPAPVPTVSAFDSSALPSTSLVKPVWIYTDDFDKKDSASITVAANSVISIMKSSQGEALIGAWIITSKNPSVVMTLNGQQNEDGTYSINPSITPVAKGKTTVTLENTDTQKLIKLNVTVTKAK